MTVRAALKPAPLPEDAITVAQAARRLGGDPTTIRELLRKGLLAGVRIGKTDNPGGVRIKVWSIIAWEERHAMGRGVEAAKSEDRAPPRRTVASNAAHEEAEARLRAWGV